MFFIGFMSGNILCLLIFVFSFLCFCQAYALDEVRYYISKPSPDEIVVQMDVQGTKKGETDILIPYNLFSEESWVIPADQKVLSSKMMHKKLVDWKFKFEVSAAVPMDNALKMVKIDGISMCYMRYKHKPGATFSVTYSIPNINDGNTNFQNIKGGGMIFLSEKAFVMPYSKKNRQYRVSVYLNPQDDWGTLNTTTMLLINKDGFFNADEPFEMTMKDMMSALFIIGAKMDFLRSIELTKDNVIRIFYLGDDNKLIDRTVLHNIDKMVQNHCLFFNCQKYKKDLYDQYFLFFIEPVVGDKSALPGSNIKNINIVDLNGFTRSESDMAALYNLIAHENIHNFVGANDNVIHFTDINSELLFGSQWFNEGFVEYLAQYLNFKNGITNLQQYIASINFNLETYFSTYKPLVESLPPFPKNNRAAITYIFNASFQNKMNYIQGMLLALDLDYILEKRTFGKCNFEDLIKKLLEAKCSNLSCSITLKDLESAYNVVIQSDERNTVMIKTYFDNYMKFGARLDLPFKILNGKAVLANRKFRVLDIGFYPAAFMKGIASGVDKNSNAYKAGLREGDVLTHFEMNSYKLNEPLFKSIALSVKDMNGQTKVIKYAPIAEREIPQYTMSH